MKKKFTRTVNMFFLTCNELISSKPTKTIKVLCEAPTAAGKTTIISHLPKIISSQKIIFINLAPSVVVVHRIKSNQLSDGLEVHDFKSFCTQIPNNHLVSIVDTWSSINNKNSNIHEDGDNKGLIKILRYYVDEGYQFIVQIDEAHSFINDESNESSKILSYFPENRLELHYTATPEESMFYDRIIKIPEEEIIETGRLKSSLELLQEGHYDDFELITDSIEKLKSIEKYYEGDTVSLQIFCPTGDEYKKIKKTIKEIAESNEILEEEIFDLTIEGRSDNTDKNIENFIQEVSTNPKHKYKIILTKYAGGVGLDCPSIGIQCFLRTPDKNAIKSKIQYFGRGRRSHRGIKPKNEYQDTLYVYVKGDYVFPEYQSTVFKTNNKSVFILNKDLQNILPKLNTNFKLVEDHEFNFESIEKFFSNINIEEILMNNFSVGKKYNTGLNTSLTGSTIMSLSYEDYQNNFNEIPISTAINLKREIELKWNNTFNNGFFKILDLLKINESKFLINLKKNGKFRQFFMRDGIKEVSKLIQNSKFSNIKNKEYVFLDKIERHKTHIKEEVNIDSIIIEKLVYQPSDGFIYFDSSVEKDVFNSILNNKRTSFLFQNLRTNQGGVSFYIPDQDVFHAPDFIFRCNENIWFAEITNYTNLSEKINFIKSKNIPNNYMLIVKDSKNQLLCLKKENFDESKYYELQTWKKLLETYVNL
jgi:superfamily II DNA or RNA helicase